MADYFLLLLVILPLLFAVVVPFLPNKPNEKGEEGAFLHQFATLGAGILFVLSLLSWGSFSGGTPGFQPHDFFAPWFPSLGISFALGMDGISMTLVVLTTFLVLMAVIASYTSIKHRHKLYYSMIFILTASLIGVFTARDSFLFFLFYELELIPMYFLIAIWGGPRRDYAAMKFVLYTLFGSIFLVAGILGLYFYAQNVAVDPSTAFHFETITNAIRSGAMPMALQIWLFAILFIGFSVKLPMVPFHTWLPDAHVEAPTPISMLLAGVLLKMGAYGMLRFCFEFLPEAAPFLVYPIGVLAFINIVYTAGIAMVQKDMKKLIAYSSVSHMGFVLLGLASLTTLGLNGAVFVMLSHGIVSAALFMCVGTLYTRTHTRMIAEYGGFAARMPITFYFFLLMGMASLGLPFLISFPGESLVLYGAFLSNAFDMVVSLTILSAIGVVLGAAYVLWLIKRVFTGAMPEKWQQLNDACRSEVVVLTSMTVLVLVFGLCPHLLTKQFEPDTTAIAMPYAQRYGIPPQFKSSRLSQQPSVSGEQGVGMLLKSVTPVESASSVPLESTTQQL